MNSDRKILQFSAATGFLVVLEFGNIEEMKEYEDKITHAGLKCKTLENFSFNFDQADLFMDMRSPDCRAQFDLEDWI
ncbi:MAG: hypothetical protein HOL15_10045 [Nitrospinaceae bacterium]|jgi:hypothetical protein|nr:hypothetical protein [Nitrospina sp.]MBT5377142.1 hypothetical protein [Nitrospinaceae bacterium]MBT5868537.1 hypothetical protein [Nitrospinaceae bacterium]MBT6346841.1 hypothetical protein [Nitrospina sp.]